MALYLCSPVCLLPVSRCSFVLFLLLFLIPLQFQIKFSFQNPLPFSFLILILISSLFPITLASNPIPNLFFSFSHFPVPDLIPLSSPDPVLLLFLFHILILFLIFFSCFFSPIPFCLRSDSDTNPVLDYFSISFPDPIAVFVSDPFLLSFQILFLITSCPFLGNLLPVPFPTPFLS